MRTVSMLALVLLGCDGSQPAITVELPVATSAAAPASATTDLGYQVELAQLRVAISGLQFTTAGEAHAVARVAGPRPHPGHSAGGDVTGELPGDFILTWNGQPQPDLGVGTLIVGTYRGANFTLRATTTSDGLVADDPLLGHTFHLTATITKDGTTRGLDAVLDVEPDSGVIGAVFEHEVTETSTTPLELRFFPTDPYEADTAFDGIDFFALPVTADGVIEIRPGDPAHNFLRRTIQSHDHYGVFPR